MENRTKMITYGDRIYVAINIMGRRVSEFATSMVADFTELIGEVRHYTHGMRGLVTLSIRNASRGWTVDRPLMLYSPGRRNADRMAVAQTPSLQAHSHMPFPWETH